MRVQKVILQPKEGEIESKIAFVPLEPVDTLEARVQKVFESIFVIPPRVESEGKWFRYIKVRYEDRLPLYVEEQ